MRNNNSAATSRYYKEWYRKNKEALNKRRREKYKNDPVYRERCKEINRLSKRKNRVYLAEQVEKHMPYEPGKTLASRRFLTGKHGEVDVYSISIIAARLGYHKWSVTEWVKKGVIPSPMMDKLGRRWFSTKYIDFLVKELNKHKFKVGTWRLKEFSKKVWEDFARRKDIPESSVPENVKKIAALKRRMSGEEKNENKVKVRAGGTRKGKKTTRRFKGPEGKRKVGSFRIRRV